MQPSLGLYASKTAAMVVRLFRGGSMRNPSHRISSGQDRMAAQAWAARTALVSSDQAPAGRALQWIRANQCAGGGIRVHPQHRAPYAEVTGYIIPTLINYGEIELAARCTRWLIRVQRTDGAYVDPDHGLPYVFDTGQALRGLLAAVELDPGAADAAQRAATYLCAKAVEGGRGGFDVRYPDVDPLSTHLYVLGPLLQAAEFFGEPPWREVAERCLEHYINRTDAILIDTLTHDLGYELEALLDLSRRDLAEPVLTRLSRLQLDDGSLRGVGGQTWICTPGLAQIAVCWYKAGQSQPADMALNWLENHQLRGGGFLGSYGDGAAYFPNIVPAWAVKFYLDAHRLRVLATVAHNAVGKSG